MNTLSLLLYLGDITNGLSAMMEAMGTAGLFLIGFIHFFKFVEWMEPNARQENKPKLNKLSVFLCALVIFLSTFVPSRDTIYLIAASELGEEVVTSPEVKDMLNDVRSYIKKNLNQSSANEATCVYLMMKSENGKSLTSEELKLIEGC